MSVTVRQAGVRWLQVGLLFLVAAVSFLDRNNIAVAAASIQQELGLSNPQMGVLFSAFLFGYAFSQPLAGRVADRFGPRRVVAGGLLAWSVLTALTAAVTTWAIPVLAGLLVCRVLLGVGESVIFPSSNRLVAAWVPPLQRGRANGIVFAGVGIGAGVAPPLITALTAAHDWRYSFYITALIGLVAALVWWPLVRDEPGEHPWWRGPSAAPEANVAAAASPAKPARWSVILAHRPLQWLCASYFTYGYVAYIYFTWFFKYLTAVRGINLRDSAWMATLPFIAMALAAPCGGWLSDQVTRRFGARWGRCRLSAAVLAASAVFVALSTAVTSPIAACICLAGGAGCLYLSQSAYWTVSATLGGRSAGSVSGVMNLCNQVGGITTAMVTPWIGDRFGWPVSFLAAATLCLLGAAAWLATDPDTVLAPDPPPQRD